MRSIRLLAARRPRWRHPRSGKSFDLPQGGGRRRSVAAASCAMAVALVAGVFSVVAIATTATVAGATTTPVAASWSGPGRTAPDS